MLETGTGTGSLTTSLARCIAPTGHVHTFEFHEGRANAARDDFARNGARKPRVVMYFSASIEMLCAGELMMMMMMVKEFH